MIIFTFTLHQTNVALLRQSTETRQRRSIRAYTPPILHQSHALTRRSDLHSISANSSGKEMVESDLSKEEVEHDEGQDIEIQELGFRREPSFSGWCDEDGVFHLDEHVGNTGASEEDIDFELPLLRHGGLGNGFSNGARHQQSEFPQRTIQMNGDNNMDGVSTRMAENGNEKYEPFDIENRAGRQLSFSSIGMDGSNGKDSHEASPRNSSEAVSIADVVKTLILILVWYTFSTFLTLYNKTLLGDDMGRFPAPLLMNTVHFAMQAVLSKGITWFWSQRFKSSVIMSWRDYFLRVLENELEEPSKAISEPQAKKIVPTALGTALDINLSNASLVFISVTFATMCKSASPIFLLLFAFAFRLESPSVKLLGIIFIISAGILLTVARETEFEFWGFIFVMLAAVMSGFRWSMTQILLQ
ncbi:hypothetical protein RJ639_040580, partial [Escallonia herrerae]